MIVTIIGSRSTPQDVLSRTTAIARKLAEDGWVLRSGGADGADAAGEAGFDSAGGQKEIYLPWKGFNGNNSSHFDPPLKAYELASNLHPVWDKLKDSVRRLHARNCQQILGENLDRPSDLVVCWTEGGKEIGGTATAIKLAKANNIPVFNLGSGPHIENNLWIAVTTLKSFSDDLTILELNPKVIVGYTPPYFRYTPFSIEENTR